MNGNRSNKTIPDIKRCAIYTRKSTSLGLEQEFNSLDAQREACEMYITNRAQDGWQLIPKQYDDGGFTGANIERPAFQKLLDDVDVGLIEIVVVYKVDRLSRSLLDFARVMDRFNQKGVAFVSVTQNFSTADAMGRLTLNMLMSFAEFEREMIAERTRDKIAAARRKGKWTGGQVPLGYDVQDKKLVINEFESVVVHEIFELYEKNRSALAVAKALNNKGRTTKAHRSKTGRWGGGRSWTKNDVLRVLKNGVYAGYISYGDELHKGEHEAIIDKERFARIGLLLNIKKKNGLRQGNNPKYLLRGILRCGQCGQRMTTASTRKNKKTYRYYRCISRDKKGAKACSATQIPAIAVEEFVVERIREATLDGALVKQISEELKTAIDDKRSLLAIERRDLPREIAKLSDEGRRLVDKAIELEGAAARLLEERLERVGAQLGKAESRLMRVEKAMAELERAELEGNWLTKTIENFDSIWDTMTPENRIRLVNILVKSVTIDEENDTVTAVLTDLSLPDIGLENEQTPEKQKLVGVEAPHTEPIKTNEVAACLLG